jgi:uncharacterized repeat protein (TIGR02543 family)
LNKFVSAITAAILPVVALVGLAASPAQAVGNTFACNSDLYQVSDGAGSGGIGGLYKFNTGTQTFARVGSGAISNINAAGRNPADGYMYAFDGSSLVKIDNTGTFTSLGTVSGSPKTTGGDFLPWTSGDAYMLTVGRNAFTKVNVNTKQASAFTVTNGNLWDAADLTISADGTTAYGMDNGTLDILDLTQTPPVVTNKTVTNASDGGNYNYGSSFGAAYTDSAGDLFFYANYDSGTSQGGYMYTISASELGNAHPVMSQFGGFSGLQGPNDGASCGSAASLFAPVVTTDQVSATSGSATLTGTVSTDARTGSDVPAGGIKICTSTSNDVRNGLLSYNPVCGDASPSFLAIATNATAVSRTVSGLTGNEYYQVKATNTAGLTGFGDVLQLGGGGGTSYTITWDARGGSVSPAANTVAAGTPVSLPTPSLSGYTFDGWFDAISGGNQQVGAITVNSNGVLYAHWTANAPAPTTYNVYFTNLGGYVSQGSGVAGSVISCPPAPVRAGYTFKGWGSCSAGGNYTITGNITLEAQWEKTTVVVNFNSNGSTVNSQTVTPGSVIDCPLAPVRAGYTFKGWPGCIDGKLTVTGAANIEAQWEKTSYPITFTSNGESVKTTSGTSGSEIECPAAPTRTGYTFLGWPGCVDGKFTVSGAATIDAHWIENLAPVPNPPADGGGQTGHETQPTTLLPNSDKDGLKLTAPGWSLDLIGQENGVNVPLDTLGRIVFQEGHLAHTSGSGFKPNSDVHVYIFSTPILLGILHTDANGNFVGDLPLPAGLVVGDHTVQVDGYAPDNSVRTADVPVVYAASKPATVTKSVFFNPDSTKLSAYTIKKITNLVKGLPAGSTLVTARIVGFVYPINSAAANKKISNGRAKNIAALLKKLGVTGNFTVIGAGRDKVADPTARRVDVSITYTTLVTAP